MKADAETTAEDFNKKKDSLNISAAHAQESKKNLQS